MQKTSTIKVVLMGLVALGIAFGVGLWIGQTRERLREFDERSRTNTARFEHRPEKMPGVESVSGDSAHLRLNPKVIESLKVRVAAVRRAPLTEPLVLTGSLFLDSSHLAVVHTRFPGEIVEVGQVPETDAHGNLVMTQGVPSMRQLRAGDHVTKGQLIAVVWSKEIGETKSDLVEALSRKAATKATVERLEGLEKGSVSGQVVREAQQKYQSDVIAVERAERTLRSWRETDEEIKEVYAESARIVSGVTYADSKVRQTWANVEIRAPLSGTVMERNGTVGEIIAIGTDLFTIADLSRMGVLANIYEEDIHKVANLLPEQRSWRVRLKAEPESMPIEGRFEVIGHVVDPSVHTAAVVGWIENPGHRLRTGQFITATVDIPGPTDAVVIPNSAVIDEGTKATVLISADASMRDVRARNVNVIRRGRDFALIQRTPTNRPDTSAFEALLEGELVVTSGNLELYGFLQDRPAELGSRASAEVRH
ncbi:efflux RND transporter periplasmic adaptor subunit [Schlesneria paludicola]|uniref:efflux RND transporter periplasmic adaptor subunit n=1 Tax=Schlesneria paludicola TaxID=360056 RepID=UPI00029ABFAF|nr:efflux RND transporter periplasmic adaptor subunit [Schlesneria paludicola]